jgi:hypothetical protein
MSKAKHLLHSVFSTANLNGCGALLMSADVGTSWSTYLYAAAVTAGTYNKYHSLTKGEGASKNALMHYVSHPAITAAAFMGAAGYNFANATANFITGPDDMKLTNLFFMAGWGAAFLGDNALRRLDSVNFKNDAKSLGNSIKSKLTKTFNALCSNPTLFYGFASTGLVMAELAHRKDELGQPLSMFAGPEGTLGAATGALVLAGTAYALRRTWQAAQDKIPTEKINDGTMNSMAFLAKMGYTGLAFVNGQFGLAAGHFLFSVSSLKTIFETRSALNKEGASKGADPKLPDQTTDKKPSDNKPSGQKPPKPGPQL